jgi:hypothetical protein
VSKALSEKNYLAQRVLGNEIVMSELRAALKARGVSVTMPEALSVAYVAYADKLVECRLECLDGAGGFDFGRRFRYQLC